MTTEGIQRQPGVRRAFELALERIEPKERYERDLRGERFTWG